MHTRELESTVRDLVRQRTAPAYIRHYLMENYQVDPKMIDQVFAKLRIEERPAVPGPGPGPGPAANRGESARRRAFQ